MKHDYDAELDQWLVISMGPFIVLIGRVYGDRKRRFADGTTINTSIVLTPLAAIESGQVITTLNSRYLLSANRVHVPLTRPPAHNGRRIRRDIRHRLTRPGLAAFFILAQHWGLSPTEQRIVLGRPSPATWRRWRRGHVQTLQEDTLIRISFLLGIHRALATLLPAPGRAAIWLRASNQASLFGGRSALEVLSSGQLEDLQAVRRYLDAQLS